MSKTLPFTVRFDEPLAEYIETFTGVTFSDKVRAAVLKGKDSTNATLAHMISLFPDNLTFLETLSYLFPKEFPRLMRQYVAKRKAEDNQRILETLYTAPPESHLSSAIQHSSTKYAFNNLYKFHLTKSYFKNLKHSIVEHPYGYDYILEGDFTNVS